VSASIVMNKVALCMTVLASSFVGAASVSEFSADLILTNGAFRAAGRSSLAVRNGAIIDVGENEPVLKHLVPEHHRHLYARMDPRKNWCRKEDSNP
jgi:hypothetical protein